MAQFKIQARDIKIGFTPLNTAVITAKNFAWSTGSMAQLAQLVKAVLLNNADPVQSPNNYFHLGIKILPNAVVYDLDAIRNVYINNRIPPQAGAGEREFWQHMGFKPYGCYMEIIEDAQQQGDIYLDNGIFLATAEHLNQVYEGERNFEAGTLWLYTNTGHEQQVISAHDLKQADAQQAWITFH